MPCVKCDVYGSPYLAINLIFQAMQRAKNSVGDSSTTNDKPTFLVSDPQLFNATKFKNVPSNVKDTIKRDIPDYEFYRVDVVYRGIYATGLVARLFRELNEQKGLFNDEIVNGFVVAGRTNDRIYGSFVSECEKLKTARVLIGNVFELGYFIKVNVSPTQMNRYLELFEITLHGGSVEGDLNIQSFHNTAATITANWKDEPNPTTNSSYHKKFQKFKNMPINN